MPRPWHFVLPEERSQPSGGNIYNERIIQALEQVGQSVEIISVDKYLQAVHQNQAGTYWVDTLVLEPLQEILAIQPSRVRSILIVHHLESLAPPPGESAEALRAKEKPFLNWFQGFLATSSFTRNYLRQLELSQPVLIAEPGIELPQKPANTNFGSAEKLHVLMVANLVERKGILPWLHWLAQNVQVSDLFSLTVVGRTDIEPAYAQQCTELVENHPLLYERITLTGSHPPDQIANFYQQANLFISTATMETFGMALQEARIHRLPILTLNRGYSAQHVVAGQNGYSFSGLSGLGDFFLNLVRKPAKFATLYQQTQQQPLTSTNWPQTARLLLQQFDQFFIHAP